MSFLLQNSGLSWRKQGKPLSYLLLLFSCQAVSNSATATCKASLSLTISPCPLNQCSHSTISSSVALSCFCLQSFPALGSFPISQLFASGGHSTGASVSASVPPKRIEGWVPLRLTGLISLLSKGLSRVFSTPQSKCIDSLTLCLLYATAVTSIHDNWKDHSLDYMVLVSKVTSFLFNTLSRFVTAFLPRSNCLLISWLLSPSTGILKPKKRYLSLLPSFPHLFAMKWWDWMPWS